MTSFFYSSIDFGTSPPPPIFGNAIATIAKKKISTPISAMALPQSGCHKFFFSPYFGNAIATITFPQIFFFLPILAMALPQLVCQKFFSPYFGNAITTISLSQIFLTNNN